MNSLHRTCRGAVIRVPAVFRGQRVIAAGGKRDRYLVEKSRRTEIPAGIAANCGGPA